MQCLNNQPKAGLVKWYNVLGGSSAVITLFLDHLWTFCSILQYHWHNSVQFLHNVAGATHVFGAFLTFDSPAVSPYASASPPESNLQGA